MGTADFAVTSLERMVEAELNIVAVYTQPPRPAGRGQKLRMSPVGIFAKKNRMKLLTPLNFSTASDLQTFKSLKADVVFVIAYGLILPSRLLKLAQVGFFNLHASLLPRWRGAAPIQRAILAGDKKSGVCLIKIEPSLDTGPIALRESLTISAGDDAGSLHKKLSILGADLTLNFCNSLDEITYEKQSKKGITYAKKVEKHETRIDWSLSAEEVFNAVRAFSPYPGAWFVLNGERIKLLKCSISNTHAPAGLVSTKPFEIACKTGSIQLELVQRAGKTPVNAEEFLRGYQISDGIFIS